jgi:hypothetical protein
MALVYRHIKPDGEVFYIGIGSNKKRAYTKHGRNRFWHNTVAKYGYEVQILTNNIDYDFAKELEMILISYYGRRDLKKGSLVNLTDGAEGNQTLSENQLESCRTRIIEYNKNKKDYSFTQDDNYKLKMRNSLLGKHNKKVVNIETNVVYESLRQASVENKLNYSCLSEMLNNKRTNKTKLRWQN